MLENVWAMLSGSPTSPLDFAGSWLGAVPLVFAFWCLVEIGFYIWFSVELRRAQELVPPPKVSLEDRTFVLEKMLKSADDGLWRQVQGWFRAKDGDRALSPHEVGRDDLIELLAWAFFYKQLDDLDSEELAWVEYVCEIIAQELRSDQGFRPGRSGVTSVRHTLDMIHVIHRPLVFYLVVQILYLAHGILLRLRGFHRGHHEGLWYWYRLPGSQPKSSETSKESTEPLVFFHGIGFGLFLYLPLLLRLPAQSQVLFEMPWISMNPFVQHIPSSSEYAQWVVEALEKHDVHSCVALGHSFGSLPISWLIRHHPGTISRCIMVDPVAILLNLPDVCINFLYRRPKSLWGKVIRVFGAREFGIAKTLMRHFFWTENVLFPDMLPDGSSVVLMGNDGLLPVKDIYTCSAKMPQIRTAVLPGLEHGHFLLFPSTVRTILEHVCGEQSEEHNKEQFRRMQF